MPGIRESADEFGVMECRQVPPDPGFDPQAGPVRTPFIKKKKTTDKLQFCLFRINLLHLGEL